MVLSIGDAGDPAGTALKGGITGGMNAVIRKLGEGVESAEFFFLTVELRALQAYVALKPLINAVDKIGGVMGKLNAVPGQVAGAESKGLGLDAGKTAEVQANVPSLGSAIVKGVTAPFTAIPELFMGVLSSIADAKAQEVAHASGVAAGKAVISGIKEGTQTHSPSLAAIQIGMGIGAGLGMGIEDSPAPERAARTVSANALGGLAGGAANGNGAGSSGGATSNVFHINITAPDGVTDAKELSMVGLATAFERFQIGSGR
jgi:hypothetical protein